MRKVFPVTNSQSYLPAQSSRIGLILHAFTPSLQSILSYNITSDRKPLLARLLPAALSFTFFAALFSIPDVAGQSAKRTEAILSPEAQANIRRAISSVGLILVRAASDAESQSPRPRGSGVVVRSDGLVVTNYHVIFENRSGRLYEDIFFSLAEDGAATEAQRYRLRAALLNKEMDLALLKIYSESGDDSTVFPAIEIGDSHSIQLLDNLTIIGFPQTGGTTVTTNHGVVEGKDRLNQWIKTDARVMHGNSGGAAVTNDGKLIGIPTKVVADTQLIDTNGDGYPDLSKTYGAVGFLRPSHLIAEMIAKLSSYVSNTTTAAPAPIMMAPPPTITLRGVIRSVQNGKAIAGARVGLVSMGTQTVTPQNLLAWGGTNADGEFTFNKAVPPGKYTLKARAIGYEAYSRDIEIDQKTGQIIVELQAIEKR